MQVDSAMGPASKVTYRSRRGIHGLMGLGGLNGSAAAIYSPRVAAVVSRGRISATSTNNVASKIARLN